MLEAADKGDVYSLEVALTRGAIPYYATKVPANLFQYPFLMAVAFGF